MFKSLLPLPWRRPAPPAALPMRPSRAEENASPAGCGWFDSSHELCRGLVVQEHANPDTVASELPLAGWLELTLAGWSAAA